MLRAGELKKLVLPLTTLYSANDSARIVFKFFDKTHYDDYRAVHFPRHPMWRAEFDLLAQALSSTAVANLQNQHTPLRIFGDQIECRLRSTLQSNGVHMGSLRPTGLMLHLYHKTEGGVIVKMAGWSPKAATHIRSYLRMDHAAAMTPTWDICRQRADAIIGLVSSGADGGGQHAQASSPESSAADQHH